MFGISKINWKNTAENLALVLITFIIGSYSGYKISVKTAETMLEQQKELIIKAIDKETIKNEILNKIDVKIDKIKKSDNLKINIKQDPKNDQKPTNIIMKTKDSILKKKKGFFKRLFPGKDK